MWINAVTVVRRKWNNVVWYVGRGGVRGIANNLEMPEKKSGIEVLESPPRLKAWMDLGGFGSVGYVEWGART